MKRTIAGLLALALVFALAGCTEKQESSISEKLSEKIPTVSQPAAAPQPDPGAVEEPEKKNEKNPRPEKPAEPEPLPDDTPTLSMRLCGTYRGPTEPDSTSTALEITEVAGILMLERGWFDDETGGSYYTFNNTEFRPDDPARLFEKTPQSGSAVHGTVMTSSGFALAGGYWDPLAGAELSEDGEKLEIVPDMSSAIPYELDDTLRPLHNLEDMKQYFGAAGGDASLTGAWEASDAQYAIYLKLNEDGTAVVLKQMIDRPMEYLRGFWSQTGSELRLLCVKAGWGDMPFEYTLTWRVTGGGLVLADADGMDALIPVENALTLSAAAEDWVFPDLTADRVYDDGLIEEIVSEEGSYKDEFGYDSEYSFHVPQLKATTPDADRINSEILEKVGQTVQDMHDAMAQKLSLMCYEVSWEAYWNGSMVSLVIKTVWDWNVDGDFIVYNYDFSMGRQVVNEELLRRIGIDGEEFLSAMREVAVSYYDGMYYDLPAQYKDAFYDQQREWTGSDENINMDLMIYLDENGALAVITPIGSLAGANWYYHIIYPFAKG